MLQYLEILNVENELHLSLIHYHQYTSNKCRRSKSMWHVTIPPPALGRAVRGSGRGAGAGRHPSWAEQLCATITYCRVEPGFCWGFLSILTMNFNQSHVTSIDKRGSNNWWVARCLILHWESSTAPNGLVEKEPQVMIEFIVLKF